MKQEYAQVLFLIYLEELTHAEAAKILQSIGNRDKYRLSAQGVFNADIVGDYDGITAADALAIQQLDTQGEL